MNLGVLLDEVEAARPLFAMPGSTEIDAIITAELQKVMNGEMSVQTVIETVKPQVEAVIERVRR